MAIGAHADDLEIHLGGSLAKYRELGYEIVYVMATNNMSGSVTELKDGRMVEKMPRETPVAMMRRRKAECAVAAAALGTTALHLDHPQRHYNSGQEKERLKLCYGSALPEGICPDSPTILTASEDSASVNKLADLIVEKNPECIFTHGLAQRNIEHIATGLLVTISFWEAVARGFEGGLLHWREAHTLHGDFNCRWETFIDCTRHLDRKMELIGLHRCQMPKAHLPDFGHRILTESRGKSCGVGAAEVFTWVRRPVRREGILGGNPPQPEYGELSLELVQNSR